MSVQRKRDLWLISGLFLIAALLVLLLYPRDTGSFVEVSVDGMVVAIYPLSTDRSVLITGVGGENLLIIENEKAQIIDADCPDHLCENMPSISHVGATIVCLPHRVVVRITGAENGADAILRRNGRQEVLR